MGDMLTLIEKAEEVFEKDEAEAAAAKLLEGEFTLDDFLDQMQQIKKMGPLSAGSCRCCPGVPKEVTDVEIDDRQIGRVEAIIRSMTTAERGRPRAHRRLPPHPHRHRLGHRRRPRSASSSSSSARCPR